MFDVIMVITMLIITIVVFASYQSSANIRDRLRLSVSFPRSHVNDREVMDIVTQYKKSNQRLFMVTILLIIPVLIIYYTSFILLYLTLWIGVVLIFNNNLFCKYNSKLLLLKSEKLWFIQEDYHLLDRDKIQRQRHKLIHKFFPTAIDKLQTLTKEPIYVDDDEYWINGYYYNPKDRSTMVEKRVGVGSTANLATKSGKITIYGSVAFILVVLIGIFSIFAQMDFITFQMVIGDTSVKIEAPLYDYEFDISDIEEINLAYTLPKGGMRINGAGTEAYLLGNFRFEEYGSSKMYVYRDYPPYIVIKLSDRTVFFNSKSEEETLLCFELLTQKQEGK